MRTELAFRLWGPIELGSYLQMATLGFPAQDPGFGGGLMVQARPESSLFGFLVPIAEISGTRVTLPTDGGRIDGWGLNVAGGVGVEPGLGLVIEARLAYSWYFDLPVSSGAGDRSWTLSAGLTYRLP